MTTRREFLSVGAAASLVAVGGPLAGEGTARRTRSLLFDPVRSTPAHPLRILLLGGTRFFGPHQIAYALGRGHAITTFTRGRTEPTVHRDVFDHVEELYGDRDGDLESLRGRSWDAVIDNSGSRVAWTEESATLLESNVELYVYTSSTGVYYPYPATRIDEDRQPLLEVPDGVDADRAGNYGYGVMKANSELAARRVFGDGRTIVVRPTYVVGPGDNTDRFTYWPVRLARGGDVLVPGLPDDPVQYIDVRDLAGWMIRLIEQKAAGTYNAVGPAARLGMHRFVHGAHAAFSSAATLVAVDDYDFLREHGVGYAIPWIMPVDDNAGSARIANDRAVAQGLTYTPLARTVHDIHEWWESDAVSEERRDALVSGPRALMRREAEILAAWRARG